MEGFASGYLFLYVSLSLPPFYVTCHCSFSFSLSPLFFSLSFSTLPLSCILSSSFLFFFFSSLLLFSLSSFLLFSSLLLQTLYHVYVLDAEGQNSWLQWQPSKTFDHTGEIDASARELSLQGKTFMSFNGFCWVDLQALIEECLAININVRFPFLSPSLLSIFILLPLSFLPSLSPSPFFS